MSLPKPGQRLGRFRLLSLLGRGAQATVWRAHDERLDREVALKLLRRDATAQPVSQWLHEARAVSRLAHPHIVPVFEADEIDGQPCLVFELVPGLTLAEQIHQRGARPAREAVELMLGVVDALRAAHAQGIVHRDLKPSNILLDAEGRARVMDFGIAARMAGTGGDAPDGLAGCIVGTPGYLSPEAAVAALPSPQMDVFAAGLVLGELLCGKPLLAEREPRAALRRVQQEDLLLPDAADADDRLRAIVQRAIARDPANRYDSAASLRDALMQWLAPADDPVPDSGSGHGTLDFLLRRMRHKSDFPALTEHVLRIQRMANSDSESLGTLADEILKDVALTQKLLRMVNTAQYRRNNHGVATVSRAVALVGLAGIRNLALSLVLVEHMKDKHHAQRLKEEFLRSLLAGQLAHALSSSVRDAEEAFLGAMFYNLGKLLAEYYFPDEAEAIRDQLRLTPSAADARVHPDLQADRAAGMVLGLGFEALGVGVARHWGLPDTLQRCMRRPEAASPAQPMAHGPERLRWLSVAANELSDAVWQGDEQTLPQRLEAVAQRHGRALGFGLPDLRRAVDAARGALAEMAPAMGLSLPKGSRAQQLLAQAPEPARDTADSLLPHQLAATLPLAAGAAHAATVLLPSAAVPGQDSLSSTALVAAAAASAAAVAERSAVADVLAAGIQDITDTLSGDSFRLNEVLRMVLETMYRALRFQRMVFCLRDPATGRLNGRFGLGDQAAALSPVFQVPLRWPAGQPPDLFGAVCLKGSDTLIADSQAPAIAQRLPVWYRQQVNAPSFLLLPMMMKGAPFALIYADQARSGGLAVGDRELALMRTLRNQAVMAFRQLSQTG
ncbi:MAG: serine/threonine protein kinase [Burkholderiales bacterium RIFCSPHIGHO2_12_FULL_69_20]|nr:MAG: serine/threonine protein kinase [Burkholderiales bacterium RIFCSPHIGHO2_12_FULL_69_20]